MINPSFGIKASGKNKGGQRIKRRIGQIPCQGWVIAIVLLLAFNCAGANSQVFHLQNGDQLTGSIVSETEAEITIQHAILGIIVIPKQQILCQEDASELTPAAENPNGVEDGTVPTPSLMTGKDQKKPREIREVKNDAAKAEEGKEDLRHWKFLTEAGLDLRLSEVNKREAHARFKATYDKNPWHGLLDYRIEQGKTDSILSSREMTGHTRFEWDRTENQFLFNETRGKRDMLRDIDFEWEDSLGLGYKWIEWKNLKVKVDIGGNYQHQRFTDGIRQEHFALRLGESLDWKISQKLAFDQLLEVFPRFIETDNNFIRFETNLKYFLTGKLYLGLTVREVYDPEPAKDISPHDLTIRSFFGYEF